MTRFAVVIELLKIEKSIAFYSSPDHRKYRKFFQLFYIESSIDLIPILAGDSIK